MSFDIGLISHFLGAFFFLGLLVWQIKVWNKGSSSFVLLAATTITFGWCLSLVFQASFSADSFYVIQIIEISKSLAWFSLLLSILGLHKVLKKPAQRKDNRELLIVSCAALGIPLFLMGYLIWVNLGDNSSTLSASTTVAGFLIIAVVGLALLEQVIRNTRFQHKWHLKFLCLGLGILFCFDLYMYSDALLFGRIESVFWKVRGVVIALSAPLIAVSILRTREQPIQVNISRRLVFHTGVILAAGVYLLLMSLAGFYVQTFEGEWGYLLKVLFWVVSLSLLVVLIYSGRLRSSLKVYISRNLFSSKYDYRDEWLRISRTLSSMKSDESLSERSIRALAEIVDSERGALWLTTDGKHYDQIAQLDMGWIENSSLKPDDSLIEFMQSKNWIIDLQSDEIDSNVLECPSWLLKLNKAWLLVPLILNEKLLGFVLLMEAKIKFELNWEDRDLLKTAGQQAASYLAQMLASNALSEAKQFTAFNQMSAFVVHDIKTLNSQLSLMVSNAEKHKTNPSFIEDMITTTDHAVQKMNFLLNHFKAGSEGVHEEAENFNLLELVEEEISEHRSLEPKVTFSCEEAEVFISANKNELKSSLGHLIKNAQEATEKDGSVIVTLALYSREQGNYVELSVKDTGVGMTQEFINTRLFSPFESTKGLVGMGVGVFQSRALIRKLGGDIVVSSELDVGTEFILTIPVGELES